MVKKVTLALLLLLGGGAFGAESDTLSSLTTDSTIVEKTTSTTTVAPLDSNYQEIEVLTDAQKQKYNRRYQVGGAIAMMVFVGVLIGSVQSFNPK